MNDEEYNKLMEGLREYVPYLENVIAALKKQNCQSKGPQLQKIQTLHNMITDKTRKYTVATLKRCEEVLLKMQKQKNRDKLPDTNNSVDNPIAKEIVAAVKLHLARDKLQNMVHTPKSPSPMREESPTRDPIVIPTEKVYKAIYEPSELDINIPLSPSDENLGTEERYNEERPNIYSTAAESLTSPTKTVPPPLALTVPDITKPPLTDADLEMLTTELDTKAKMEEAEIERLRKKYEEHKKKTNIKTSTPNRRPPDAEDDSIFGNLLTSIDEQMRQENCTKNKEKRNSTESKDKSLDRNTESSNKFKELAVDNQPKVYKRLADKYNPKPKPKPKHNEPPPDITHHSNDKHNPPSTFSRTIAQSSSDRIITSSISERTVHPSNSDRNISSTNKSLPSHMTLDTKAPSMLTSAYDRNVEITSPSSDKSSSVNDLYKKRANLWSPPHDDEDYSNVNSFNPITTPHYEVPLYDATTLQNKIKYSNAEYSSLDSINPYDDPRPAFPDDHMDGHYLNRENTYTYDDFRKQDVILNRELNQQYTMDNRIPQQQPVQNIDERPRDPRLCRDLDRQNFDNRQMPTQSYPNYFNVQMQPNYPAIMLSKPEIPNNVYHQPIIQNDNNVHMQQNVQPVVRRVDPRTGNWADPRLTNSTWTDKQNFPNPQPVNRPKNPNRNDTKVSSTSNIRSELKSNPTPRELVRETSKEKLLKPVKPSDTIKPNIAKLGKFDAKQIKSDPKAVKSDPKAVKSDTKAAKFDTKAAKSDPKKVKSDPKSLKTNPKSMKSDRKGIKLSTKGVKSNSKIEKNRSKSKIGKKNVQNEIKPDTKSKDLTKSVYDKVYAKIDAGEQFTSPLESLYASDTKTSRGYGFQKFKIPKKPKPIEEPKIDVASSSQSIPSVEISESWDDEIEANKAAQSTFESWDAEIEQNKANQADAEECWDDEIESNQNVEESMEDHLEEEMGDRQIKKHAKKSRRRIRLLSSDEEADNDTNDNEEVINKTNDTKTSQTDTLNKGIKGLSDGTLDKSDFLQIINSILGAQQTKKLAKIQRILQSDESSEDDDEININTTKQKTEIEKNFDEAMKQLKKIRTNKKDAKQKDKLKKEEVKKERAKPIRRTELDRLHEDIKEVMGENMHKTSIKRNCTVTKAQSKNTSAKTKKAETAAKNKSEEKPVAVSNNKETESSEDNVSLTSNESSRTLRSSTRNLRVLVEKTDLSVVKNQNKEEPEKKSSKTNSVTETRKYPKRKRKQAASESNLSDTSETEDDKVTKSVNKKATKLKKFSKTNRKLDVDNSNTGESNSKNNDTSDVASEFSEFNDVTSRDGEISSSSKSKLPTKSKNISKTKVTRSKENVQAVELAEVNNDDTRKTNKHAEDETPAESESANDVLANIEANAKVRKAPKPITVTPEILKTLHNKDYYYQPAIKMRCKLCAHKNFNLAAHYVSIHNDYEVLISRFDPETTKQAIEESMDLNLDAEEPIDMLISNKRKHFSFSCRFCSLNYHKEFTENFYNHLTSHTGEFRNKCDRCSYASSNLKNLKLHVAHKHKTKIPQTEPPPLNYKYVFGYLCNECNYVQLHRENTKKHIELFHPDTKTRIIKISMSAFKETVIEPDESVESTEQMEEDGPLHKSVFTCDNDLSLDDDNKLDDTRLQKMIEINDGLRPARTSITEVIKTKLDNCTKEDDLNTSDMEIDKTCIIDSSQIIISELLNTVDEKNSPEFKIKIEPIFPQKSVEYSKQLPQLNFTSCTKENDKAVAQINTEDTQLVVNAQEVNPESTEAEVSDKTPSSETRINTVPEKSSTPLNVSPTQVNPSSSDADNVDTKASLRNLIKTEAAPPKKINKLLRTESIVIHVKSDSVIYTCLIPGCDYFCEESISFEEHCKTHDENVPLICNICNLKIEHDGQKVNLFELFYHLKLSHLEAQPEVNAAATTEIIEKVPLLTPKEEVVLPEDDGNKSAPLFTKSENFPMSFQLASVESQGKRVFDIEVTQKSPVEREVTTTVAPAVTYQTQLKVVPSSKLQASPTQQQQPSSAFKTVALSISPTNSSVTIPLQITAIPINNFLSISPNTNQTPTTVQISNLALLEQNQLVPSNVLAKASGCKRKSVIAMRVLLQRHRITHLYKCVLFDCSFSTTEKELFREHLTEHGRLNNRYNCLYCTAKIYLSKLTEHFEEVHGNSKYNCAYCFYKAVCVSYVKAHVRIKHAKRVIQVQVSNVIPNSQDFRQLIPKKKDLSLYECGEDDCQQIFFGIEDYRDHLIEELNSKMLIKCYKCKECFMRESTLIQHIHDQHSMHTFICGICPFGCNSFKDSFLHTMESHSNYDLCVILRKMKKPMICDDKSDPRLIDDILENCYICPRDFKIDDNIDLSWNYSDAPPDFIEIKETILDPLEKLIKTCNKDLTLEEPVKMVEQQQLEQSQPQELEKDQEEVEQNAQQQQQQQQQQQEQEDKNEIIDIYRCALCLTLLPDAYSFKQHSNVCYLKNKDDIKCYHCKRIFKFLHSLYDHMNIHAPPRFQCSLCTLKKPLQYLRMHMRKIHKVTATVCVPIDPNKLDINADHFIVRPAQEEKQKSLPLNTDKNTLQESNIKKKYHPSEVNQIPRSAISSQDLQCALCSFSSKVRMNLVRHFQFHDQYDEVPTSAPVNPVPCLEKKEKMFDKMTNLASSSHPIGRMSTGNPVKKPIDDENIPNFIPETKRYVCGAENCDYLCLEESMLRRHLQALHANEQEYKCQHCEIKLCSEKLVTNLDNIMKHYRLHDANLYKCPCCKFLHNLKNKIERHVSDRHPDQTPHYLTLREIVERNVNKEPNKEQQLKLWKCGLCKIKRSSRQEIVTHVAQMHNISAQYKCAFCNYLTEDTYTFKTHFEELHPGRNIDIIIAYYKEEDLSKSIEQRNNFDTTPLWSRDKPRVKHIRGILLDDSGKIPKKNPLKMSAELLQRTREETMLSESTKFESVLKNKNDRKPPKLTREINISITKKSSSSNETEIDAETKKIRKKPPKLERSISLDSGVIEIIDDDDEPATKKPKTIRKPTNMPPLIPLTEINRMDAISCIPVQSRLVDDVEDEDIELSDDDGDEMGIFGPYGVPLDTHFFCPLCNVMKTKIIEDFVKHLYKELEYSRYSCALCSTSLISYKTMVEHITKTHGEFKQDHVISMPANNQIESWVRKVVDVQKKMIEEYEKEPLLVPLSTSIETDLPDGQPLAKKSKSELPNKCNVCNMSFLYPSRLKEHLKKHKRKFQCDVCEYGFRFKGELLAHMKNVHKQGSPETITSTTIPLTLNNKLINTSLFESRVPRLTMDKNSLKCKYCDLYGSYHRLKIHHVNCHKTERFVVYKYKCEKCDTYYTKLGDIKEHMTNKHYKCDTYKSIFNGNTTEYKCSTCGTEYTNVLFLKLHIGNKAHCAKARILRREKDGDFIDALQSDFITYLSTNRILLQTSLPTARKSTTLTKDLINNNKKKQKNDDFSRFTITSEIDGKDKTISVKEFSNMCNIHPKVVVNDCKSDKKIMSVFKQFDSDLIPNDFDDEIQRF